MGRDKVINVRITDQQSDYLDRLAQHHNMTVSDLIRRALAIDQHDLVLRVRELEERVSELET